MNQLKLLNFHKMLANFANNLVGAFIPLIIFQATGKLTYAIIYLLCNKILRLGFNYLFKNLYGKYPQLFLLLRIIPITIYNLFIFVLDHHLIIAVIGICIFNSLDYALNNLSKEIIFNYSSLTGKSDKSLGTTRVFEQIGVIVSLVIGGYLLDINKVIVLILSLSLYAISTIPLIIFYIKCRKQKTFNKDATSNAITTLRKNEKYNKISKKLTKKLLFTYGIVYFSFALVDLLQTCYGLHIFMIQGEFATAGILNAIFNCFYAIGFYVASIINEKKDITRLVSVFCIIIGTSILLLFFIDITSLFLLVCFLYGIIGFSYPFISLFVLERMLLKTRIMACSNRALFTRETSCVMAYICGYAFGFTGLLAIFIVTTITMFASSFIIPYGEEKTRKNLVDFLQNNENINNASSEGKNN